MDSTRDLALALFDIEAVRFGRFALHSGKISPIYIDLRLLISRPSVLRQAAIEYSRVLAGLTYDLLAAIPHAGLPIGTAIALETDQPLVFPRKQIKTYGTGKQIEGKWQVGQTAIVIEDLITSGDSILQGIAALKASGLHVREALVLIDRQQGGREALAAAGYQLHAVMTMTDLLTYLEEGGRISAHERHRVLNLLN
jgi:uridine monophosphate synthetase